MYLSGGNAIGTRATALTSNAMRCEVANRAVADDGPRVWRFKRLRNKPSVIYFVQPKGQPFIKIGMTRDLWPRLCVLQTGNPHTLELLLVIEGDRDLEADIHFAATPCAVRGEWFKLDDKLQELIDHLRSREIDYNAHLDALLRKQEATDKAALMSRKRPFDVAFEAKLEGPTCAPGAAA